jgi:hypothetical protein
MSLLPIHSPWLGWYCSACSAGISPAPLDPADLEWVLTFSGLPRRFRNGRVRAVPCFRYPVPKPSCR